MAAHKCPDRTEYSRFAVIQPQETRSETGPNYARPGYDVPLDDRLSSLPYLIAQSVPYAGYTSLEVPIQEQVQYDRKLRIEGPSTEIS